LRFAYHQNKGASEYGAGEGKHSDQEDRVKEAGKRKEEAGEAAVQGGLPADEDLDRLRAGDGGGDALVAGGEEAVHE
jgi:hypothetical protein